jgi:four helix bundle protein
MHIKSGGDRRTKGTKGTEGTIKKPNIILVDNYSMSEKINNYKQLRVYALSMEAAMEIFRLSKHFTMEEKYSLTDQIRRSSRSICANIAEAWRKRRYKAAFIAKLNDAETEASETQVWLEFAFKCGYLAEIDYARMDSEYDKIIGQIIMMINSANHWIISWSPKSP